MKYYGPSFTKFEIFNFYITEEMRNRPLTRKEQISNAILRLKLVANYSYGHQEAATLVVRLLNRYAHLVIELDDSQFQKLLSICGEGSYLSISKPYLFMSINRLFKQQNRGLIEFSKLALNKLLLSAS